MAEKSSEGRRRVSLELGRARIAHIDALKKEWGISNRGEVLERLLDEIFGSLDGEEEPLQPTETAALVVASEAAGPMPQAAASDPDDMDDQTALVLIGRGSGKSLEDGLDAERSDHQQHRPGRGGGGIDLPGFVRRRSGELRDSFRPSRRKASSSGSAAPPPLPQLRADDVQTAMDMARDHWMGLYGKAPDATVLEAAMVWLATDIWPQSEQSEGRSFTWTAACEWMAELVPGWSAEAPTFERVMATAGVLEDPFSGSTLPLRIPTLIRRFVHRFRHRRRGTSFQTLEHTMTLQGALKLLQLPTDPGQRVSLGQIREAYREQAMSHHPDAGGSLEAMRRLNEAYQLLKELYRRHT